jgi:hypothetical protein
MCPHPRPVHKHNNPNSTAPCSNPQHLPPKSKTSLPPSNPTIHQKVYTSTLRSSIPSPKPAQNPPKHHHRSNNDPRQFQHGHFIPLARHHSQSPCASFQARRHVREGLGSVVDDVLVARIVVDVDCDAAQGGDFGLQGGEGVVVLSGWKGQLRSCDVFFWLEDFYLSRS